MTNGILLGNVLMRSRKILFFVFYFAVTSPPLYHVDAGIDSFPDRLSSGSNRITQQDNVTIEGILRNTDQRKRGCYFHDHLA